MARWIVTLDSETDARKVRDLLDRTTKGYNDRMGSRVWTSAPREAIVSVLDKLGVIGQIAPDARADRTRTRTR